VRQRRSKAGIPHDTRERLLRLLDRYDATPRPISVNFRKLVPWMRVGERATHYLHPYPAKLLPHIPAFFLANDVLTSPGDSVLDPFCGSGTVLLESLLHGRRGLGADSNPLARLITAAKVTSAIPADLRSTLAYIAKSFSQAPNDPPPSVVNLQYWFYPHVVPQLTKLRYAIDRIENAQTRDFFRVCFSACVRRASLADPRLSVPVRLRQDQYPKGHPFRDSANRRLQRLRRQNVLADFLVVAESNIRRVEALHTLRQGDSNASLVSTDARTLVQAAGNPLAAESVDLILTSPPYVGAQKYIRSSSLSLGWLGLTGDQNLRGLEDQNIGREHFRLIATRDLRPTGLADADRRIEAIAKRNPLRATIASTYLNEMAQALRESSRVLRPGGHLVLVAGNSSICKQQFHTQAYLRQLAEMQGLKVRLALVDAIRSRGLMTRRNSTASVITREWVLLFQKGSQPVA
jgi:DNA modification methylase